MKQYTARLFFLLWPLIMQGQQVTLRQCLLLIEKNYPKVSEKQLHMEQWKLADENLKKNFLPTVGLNLQASYQSDVIEMDIPLPGFTLTPPDKE
jgi:hypothetical protein